jgi:hypothetical protein
MRERERKRERCALPRQACMPLLDLEGGGVRLVRCHTMLCPWAYPWPRLPPPLRPSLETRARESEEVVDEGERENDET